MLFILTPFFQFMAQRCFSQYRLGSLGTGVKTTVTDKACYNRVPDGYRIKSRVALDYPESGKSLDQMHGCELAVPET